MKKLLLLLTLISRFAFGQGSISTEYNSTTKKSYLKTGVFPKANVITYTDTSVNKSPVWWFNTGRIKFKNSIVAIDTADFDGILVSKGDSLLLADKNLMVIGVTNGLTLSSGFAKIGGTLTDSTVIDMNNRSLVFKTNSADVNKEVIKITDESDNIALIVNQSGKNVIALGKNAGSGTISAEDCNFLGENAGSGATNALFSNFMGKNAGLNSTTATHSNFFGQGAGSSAPLAGGSNFLGANAGAGATNAGNSNFLGQSAGNNAVNANGSNFLGYESGNGASNANGSNFLGNFSGSNSTNANNSNFFGFVSGRNATNAYFSNFIGPGSGDAAINANNSNFFGAYTGLNSTNASNSNFFGKYAGRNAINAANSIFIGTETGDSSVNLANSIVIGKYSGRKETLNTTTGGTSIQIGNYTHTGGFNNTIAIGDSATNTKTNQVVFAPKYRHLRLRGVDYELPASQGATDTYLKNDGSGVLSWATVSGGGSGMSNALPEGAIWVGGADDTAIARIPSGDVTISNLGVTTVEDSVVTSNKLANQTSIGFLAQSTPPTPLAFGSGGTKIFANDSGEVSYQQRQGNSVINYNVGDLKNVMGVLKNDSFDRATLGYTVVGSNGSFGITTGKLIVTNTTGNTTYDQYALIGYTTMLEDYTYEAEFVGTTNGNGTGLAWIDTYGLMYSCKLDMNTAGSRGVLTIARVSSGTGTVIATAPAITYTNTTDTLHLRMRIVGYRLTAQVWKNSENPTTLNYDYPFNVSCFKRFNKLAITSFGGEQKFSNIKVYSNAPKNRKIAWVGNSNSIGANMTGVFNYQMASFMLRNKFGGDFAQYSGSGSTLVDFYNNIEEFIKLNNEIVIISLGSNDAIQGVSSSTYNATLDLILARLKRANITPILTTVSPNTTYNAAITLYNTKINSLSGNYQVIDLYTLLATGTALKTIYDTGDGLHWNASGQMAVANLIINSTNYLWENLPTLQTGKVTLDGFTTANSLYITSNDPTSGVNIRVGSADKASTLQSIINYEPLGTVGSTNRMALITGYVSGTDNYQVSQFISGTGAYKDLKMGMGLNPSDLVIKSTGLVGIGTALPASKLDVYGSSLGGTSGNTVALTQVGMPTTNVMYLQTSGIRLSTGTTWREAAIRQQLTVDATAGMGYIQYEGFAASDNVGGISFGTVNSSMTAPFSVPERMRITNIGNVGIGVTAPSSLLDVAGNVEMRHLIGNTGTPSIAAGAGAGTTPTVTLSNATDMSGIVNVTTGTIPTGTNAVVATITFETAYGHAPNVVLYPNNANTAILSGVSMVYTTSTTTTFVITSGTTALTASTAYKWFYQVVQ